jgi:hypothetical protein
MSFSSNTYFYNDFKFSTSYLPPRSNNTNNDSLSSINKSLYSYNDRLNNNNNSSSNSSLSKSYSNLSSSTATAPSRPVYSQYMSTYYTSPASSENAATIIITKKIPDYTSVSPFSLNKNSSTRSRSNSRTAATETSLTLNVNDNTPSSPTTSTTVRIGSENQDQPLSRNQESYNEFLRSPPVTNNLVSSATPATNPSTYTRATDPSSQNISVNANGSGNGESNLNNTNNRSVEDLYSYRSNSEYTSNGSGGNDGNGRKNANSNDLTATAVSNIQLNLTDDLMTQVDYCLNEVKCLYSFEIIIVIKTKENLKF